MSGEFLGTIGVFSLLSEEEIGHLRGHLHVLSLEPGQTLFNEGDAGDNLYIIAQGRMSIAIRLPDGTEHEVARVGAGDFIGEMSIFDNAPRSATCRAVEKSSLQSLSKDDFSVIIQDHPVIALKLMYRMLNITTQRLRNTSEFVTDMVLWGENARRRAVTDELTGVYNRRFLDDSLEGYAAEAMEGGVLSLMMVDLDHFRKINEAHGQQKGDALIREIAGVLKAKLRPTDIIARYGGDEFVILLPRTDIGEALEIGRAVCRSVAHKKTLKDADGRHFTVSIGIATIPHHASEAKGLCSAADAALYRAKENGRNRVEGPEPTPQEAPHQALTLEKGRLDTLKARSRTLENIINAITTRQHFLLLGHSRPDDDCLASMISFALLLHLFYKDAQVYSGGRLPDRFRYLLDICTYNSIRLLGPDSSPPVSFDTVVVLDTPKPSMIEAPPWLSQVLETPNVLKMEIDHHIGADSENFADEGYSLVTEASSASELIGHILLRLKKRPDLLERFQITELFPRNLVLTILTGIIGDSNRGQYLKSPKEKKYYEIFSQMFNDLLSRSTIKKTNFFTMDEVYSELQKLSSSEEKCFQFMMSKKHLTPSVGYAVMDEEASAQMHQSFDEDTIVSTARIVADRLAEESRHVSLVAYYDDPAQSDLIQLRIRRAGGYRKIDLRTLLGLFSIKDGGGHEGAIGFRLHRVEVRDFAAYIGELVARIGETAPK